MMQQRFHHILFVLYVLATLTFIGFMALLEHYGVSRVWLGALCFLVSIISYMLVGLYCRTTQLDQYYLAGRGIPALYNGMASAADWISAATFISLAGGLYLQGFGGTLQRPGGFAYLLGWTGGFCLVAMLAAPYLRRMNLYTLAEFFDRRYGGAWPRRIAMLASVLCSFIYMVAQIYGVGLIASRLSGVRFEIGMLLGLSGVLVCSFLGGMRSVTWTQAAQYVVLLLAFVVPVGLLAYKQTGSFVAPLAYAKQLQWIGENEKHLHDAPQERQVARVYQQRALEYAQRLYDVPAAMRNDRRQLLQQLQHLKSSNSDATALFALNYALGQLPRSEEEARERWQAQYQHNLERSQPLSGIAPVASVCDASLSSDACEPENSALVRRNALALIFCLCMGTLGLPHLLTRYFTTPSVAATRSSVAWTMLFVAIIYICVPAMAVLVKYEVMHNLVGTRFDALPQWITHWGKVNSGLLNVEDVNRDGVLQFAELWFDADLVMLAMPEIAGLPYVVSAMVAAGGLAAALSTADGLLLTIGTTLAHDGYYREINPQASDVRRVMLSKLLLLVMALAAAYVAAHHHGEVLKLVTVSFSLAASALVPALLLGIFWTGATRAGAVAGMALGLMLAAFYVLAHMPEVQGWLPYFKNMPLWWGIQPVSSGIFGVAFGALALVLVSGAGHLSARFQRRR